MPVGADRRLMLLRHAKSDWPDVLDHERPLARRGRRDAPVAGLWLRESGYVPDQVLCSTARRARETWLLALEQLGASPPATFTDRIYEASPADLLGLARATPASVRTLLIVGHEPAMRTLTLGLAREQPPAGRPPAGQPPGEKAAGEEAAGEERRALERVTVKFPTAAIAVLTFGGGWPGLGPGLARLAAFAVPADYGRPGLD